VETYSHQVPGKHILALEFSNFSGEAPELRAFGARYRGLRPRRMCALFQRLHPPAPFEKSWIRPRGKKIYQTLVAHRRKWSPNYIIAIHIPNHITYFARSDKKVVNEIRNERGTTFHNHYHGPKGWFGVIC
jgi:hypothetical protein